MIDAYQQNMETLLILNEMVDKIYPILFIRFENQTKETSWTNMPHHCSSR